MLMDDLTFHRWFAARRLNASLRVTDWRWRRSVDGGGGATTAIRLEQVIASGFIVIGTPDTAIRQIRRLADQRIRSLMRSPPFGRRVTMEAIASATKQRIGESGPKTESRDVRKRTSGT